MYEVEAATYFKKMKNDTKVGLVPNTGHTANIDQPGIYNNMLESFLEDIN
ncbi:hypothetical protein ACJROX_08235 [Pseudalkalibacillus sp. A8]